MRLVTAAVGTFIGRAGHDAPCAGSRAARLQQLTGRPQFRARRIRLRIGTVLTDPSLPLENVSNETHVGVLGFATTFGAFGQTGQFGLVVPYASIAAKGLVLGSPHARYVDGLRIRHSAFR
jgi:hypothetical protein